ncbi:MAG: hypothetical protein NTY64_23730, partial [Deltaproteobacteria bacterium]|nr:hypothetical protein [Deltaproteobacteria bacterium]
MVKTRSKKRLPWANCQAQAGDGDDTDHNARAGANRGYLQCPRSPFPQGRYQLFPVEAGTLPQHGTDHRGHDGIKPGLDRRPLNKGQQVHEQNRGNEKVSAIPEHLPDLRFFVFGNPPQSGPGRLQI